MILGKHFSSFFLLPTAVGLYLILYRNWKTYFFNIVNSCVRNIHINLHTSLQTYIHINLLTNLQFNKIIVPCLATYLQSAVHVVINVDLASNKLKFTCWLPLENQLTNHNPAFFLASTTWFFYNLTTGVPSPLPC